ncbi:SLAM family member 8-like [Rhinatrema bivittatum]|uniref:SLAM family member 8-like n=1 Tax=Rhinatrema bivittatum TaxID=194408 RepID=UPI0011287F91|nr:SLAM family member 8-like [Rhinatrema bivittatum]
MQAAWALLMSLHYLAWPAAAEASILVRGVVGEAVSLAADLPPDFEVREVIWKYLTSKEEIVATFFKGSVETMYRSHFFQRIWLLGNFSLEISQLELGDSGTFKALLVGTEGQLLTRTLQLTVYEAVSKPTIRVFAPGSDPPHSAGSGCEVFLTCAAERGSGVLYSWQRGGGTLGNGTHTFLDEGKVLKVRLEPSDNRASYCCTAANPVSQESTAVVPWDSCEGRADAEVTSHNSKYLLLILLPLLILLFAVAVLGIILCTRCSGKKTLKASEDRANVEMQPV